MTSKLLRSVLFVPASNARALAKSRTVDADALIFDLEDAVLPDMKEAARDRLRSELKQHRFRSPTLLMRINGRDTAWVAEDLAVTAGLPLDGIVLPKLRDEEAVVWFRERLPGLPLWAMIETPDAVLNAPKIGHTGSVVALIMGTNDLARDLSCLIDKDRQPLQTALQATVLAAASARIPCIDGVFNQFRDIKGLEVECAEGRRMGMAGKTLIHPNQLEVANLAFSPTKIEIDVAKRQIQAFDLAQKKGEAIAVADGSIVEELHVDMARRVLAQAEAIEKRVAE